jgi:hypothetical protein
MIRYSRAGLYSPKAKTRKSLVKQEEKQFDVLNLVLFGLLVVVVVLFFVN